MQICPNCGAELPDDARFCHQCGYALPVSVAVDERKFVTVLFADLVDSTGLGQRLDPERAREVISAFYEVATTELQSLRGRAEKFIGDAVMAVFGLPTVHEDDAVRAIRAGIAIRDRTRQLGDELNLGFGLDVHAGVASGSVAVGEGPAGQLLATGPTVNVAARLQDAAEPGEILVNETTHQVASQSVEFGPPRPPEAAGFDEALTAYPVERIAPRQTRRTIPLVGRRSELSLLRDTYDRAVASRRPHLFTLLGEPGVGKSRIVQEFQSELDPQVTFLTGTAVAYGGEVTLWPIVEMLRSLAGIQEDDPPERIRERIRETTERVVGEPNAAKVAARLNVVMGVAEAPSEGDDAAAFRSLIEGAFPQQEIQWAARKLVEGLGREGPVALVFEDLQAAQPALLDLIEQVSARASDTPLLLLCAARETLLEERPAWGGGRADAVTVRLDPLDRKKSAELARASGGEAVDDAMAEVIAEQSGGNPFFIIEMTGMLVHADREGTASSLVPPTVQAIVASRLDHLGEQARDLARKLSVFRPPVQPTKLAVIADVTDEALRELEEEEILVRDQDDPPLWRFRHQVLRDVAYESLPKRERLRLHLAVADEHEKRRSEPRFPQGLAYHLEQAAFAARDLDLDDQDVLHRAVDALANAGDRLRRQMELRSSIDHYERALFLSGPSEKWGQDEAGMLSGIGESEYWLAEYESARANLRRALELAAGDPRVIAHAPRFLADIVLNMDGDVDGAERLFQQAARAAEELEDPWVVARVRLMAGWIPSWRGQPEEAEAIWREVLEMSRENGDRWAEGRALGYLCSAVSATGDEREVARLAEEAIRLGEETDDPFTTAVSRQFLGNSLLRMGRYDEAEKLLLQAADTFEELGARWEYGAAVSDAGDADLYTGDLNGAEIHYKKGLAVLEPLEDRSYVSPLFGQLAIAAAARGDAGKAERNLGRSEETSSESDMLNPLFLYESRGDVAWLLGDREAALDAYQAGLARYAESAYVNRRARFIAKVGRRVGADAVGGEEALRRAEERLVECHWVVHEVQPVSRAGEAS